MSSVSSTPTSERTEEEASLYQPNHVRKKSLSYICIACGRPVASLFITYDDPGNTSLLECPHCHESSTDRFVEHTFSVLLVDLLLFKPRVYRHLLFNRGGGNAEERRNERERKTVGLGGAVVCLDAYIRSANMSSLKQVPFLSYFGDTLLCCVLETLSLHASIALSSILVERAVVAFLPCTPPPIKNDAEERSRLRLLPLTLFYTSLPTLFLLCISQIWSAEYSFSPTASSSSPTSQLLSPALFTSLIDLNHFPKPLRWLVENVAKGHLRSVRESIGGGWANEMVLRKGVGGSSALVGLSVLLGVSKFRTMIILLVAWSIHLCILYIIDPWLS